MDEEVALQVLLILHVCCNTQLKKGLSLSLLDLVYILMRVKGRDLDELNQFVGCNM